MPMLLPLLVHCLLSHQGHCLWCCLVPVCLWPAASPSWHSSHPTAAASRLRGFPSDHLHLPVPSHCRPLAWHFLGLVSPRTDCSTQLHICFLTNQHPRGSGSSCSYCDDQGNSPNRGSFRLLDRTHGRTCGFQQPEHFRQHPPRHFSRL